MIPTTRCGIDLCHTYNLEGLQSKTNTSYRLDQCEDNSDITTRVGSSTPYTVVAMAIIASGMILQGIVRSPVEPYLIDYIDTNVKQSSTAAYLGVISSLAILGPAVSYGLGGYFSQIHVTLQGIYVTLQDPRWIGAWWLGFIVFGTLSIVTGIPLMFFPNHYKNSVSYGNCSCLSFHGNMVSNNDLTVTPGLCSPDCQFLIPYTVVSLLFRLILSCSSIPGFILLIRSVSASDKAIAVGFTSFIITLLGWFPGPVLYGKIIDQACLLWSSKCNNKGACALYDNYKFRMFIYGTSAALNVGVFGLKVVQFFLARKKTDWSIEAENTEKEKVEGESLLTKSIPLEDKTIRNEQSEDKPI
ncbi:solute carrier organic anion transporter family member 1A4-like [Mytilus californianus]|uniref:solute carrier organic anion transporter family member 1A4-like n=1 Tax=Mytilus californianus TaxID=6549 RepID=UPI00224831C0|nr:solute carrier organic anion transporter family member 1A4-like [Mytilus californianus]